MWIRALVLSLISCVTSIAVAQDFGAPATKVQYAVKNQEPPIDDKAWRDAQLGLGGEADLSGISQFGTYWIRARDSGSNDQWQVFGPLRGENATLEVTSAVDDAGTSELRLEESAADGVEKGLSCCKVKVRIRVVTKVPKVTAKPPSVTVKWRGPVPQVTVKGPEITVRDLPQVKIDSPIPTDGPFPNLVGMRCEVVNGEAKLWVQNGESYPVDVSVEWKGVRLGPARLESKTERSLGGTGYPTCKQAQDVIFIYNAVGV